MDNIAQRSTLTEYNDLLESSVDMVNRKIISTLRKYNITYDTIIDYLKINESDLLNSQNQFELNCNSDILKKIENGTANVEECVEWKKNVAKWKKSMILGILKFEDFQFLSNVA